MTKKVQFFETDRIVDLQNDINTFIKETEKGFVTIEDIKYDHILQPSHGEYEVWYTAMVVYNKEEYSSVPEGSTGTVAAQIFRVEDKDPL